MQFERYHIKGKDAIVYKLSWICQNKSIMG